MPDNDPKEVVRLTTAANPAEAHLVEQALHAEGIQCQVVGDFLDAGIGDIPGVRAEVWVHRDDLARAEAILATLPAGGREEEENESEV
jgi:hypothetical protein